jgi:hypothetical protein
MSIVSNVHLPPSITPETLRATYFYIVFDVGPIIQDDTV